MWIYLLIAVVASLTLLIVFGFMFILYKIGQNTKEHEKIDESLLD
jgi:hypothetical protein